MGLRRLLALRGCSVRAQASVVNLQPCSESRGETVCVSDLLKRVTRLHPTDPACPAFASQRRPATAAAALCSLRQSKTESRPRLTQPYVTDGPERAFDAATNSRKQKAHLARRGHFTAQVWELPEHSEALARAGKQRRVSRCSSRSPPAAPRCARRCAAPPR